MNKRRLVWLIAVASLLIWLGLLLIIVPPAQAKPQFMDRLRAAYPNIVGTPLDDCVMCHRDGVPDGPINKFADNFFSYKSDLPKLEAMDSDGDGYTNLEELTALTFPGDPDSFPQGEVVVAAEMVSDQTATSAPTEEEAVATAIPETTSVQTSATTIARTIARDPGAETYATSLKTHEAEQAALSLPPIRGNADRGRQLYREQCAACHGPTGAGGIGPRLVSRSWPTARPDLYLQTTITEGIPNTGMLAKEEALSIYEVNDLVVYVLRLAQDDPHESVILTEQAPTVAPEWRVGWAALLIGPTILGLIVLFWRRRYL